MQDFSECCQKIWSWYDVCRLEFDLVNYHHVRCLRGYLGHSAHKYLWIYIHASYKVSRLFNSEKNLNSLWDCTAYISEFDASLPMIFF